MRTYALVAVAVSLQLAACGRVSGVDQAPDKVLLDYRSPHANPPGGPAPETRSETLTFGLVEKGKDHRVPVLVEWTTAKDAAGCLRVQTVKLTRAGGPRSTEIYKARVKPLHEQCASRNLEPGPMVDPFDAVLVAFCHRWNGAVNDDDCAYDGGFTINADAVGLEGMLVDESRKSK